MKLNIDVRIVAPVDRVIKELARAKDHELRYLFDQIHTVIKRDIIIQQLNNFVERKCVYTMQLYILKNCNF